MVVLCAGNASADPPAASPSPMPGNNITAASPTSQPLAIGAIVGIVAGVCTGLGGLATLAYTLWKWRKEAVPSPGKDATV